MKDRLEELNDMIDQTDRQMRILADAKTEMMEQAGEIIFNTYKDDIMDQEEVFALGWNLRHSPESMSDKTIDLKIEPAIERPDDVDEEIEAEKRIREAVKNIVPREILTGFNVHISPDWSYGGEDQK